MRFTLHLVQLLLSIRIGSCICNSSIITFFSIVNYCFILDTTSPAAMKTMKKKQNVTPKVGRRDFVDARGESSMSNEERGWGSRIADMVVPPPAGSPTGYQLLPHMMSHVQLSPPTPVTTTPSPTPMRATITFIDDDIDPETLKELSMMRLQELQERNRHFPPHLRSSYVVEELPGLSSTMCDERHVRPERSL